MTNNPDENSLEYAKSLGYSNIAEAIKKLGYYQFSLGSLAFKHKPKHKIINIEAVNKIKDHKPLSFNENYIIYNDGRLYSNIAKRFLNGKTEDSRYLCYELGRGNKYTAARLVFFHFCKHNKKKIEDLEQISTIDKNPNNLHYTNLIELTPKEVMLKHGLFTHKKGGRKSKIKPLEIELITKLRRSNFSLQKIADLYDVSEMGVHRFLKKHNIE